MNTKHLENEIEFLEEQVRKRKSLINLRNSNFVADEAIEELINAISPIPHNGEVQPSVPTFNYEEEKQKIEIQLGKEKLNRAKVRTTIMKVAIWVFIFTIVASFCLLYVYPAQIGASAWYVIGASLCGFILTIASSLSFKLPNKAEVSATSGD